MRKIIENSLSEAVKTLQDFVSDSIRFQSDLRRVYFCYISFDVIYHIAVYYCLLSKFDSVSDFEKFSLLDLVLYLFPSLYVI